MTRETDTTRSFMARDGTGERTLEHPLATVTSWPRRSDGPSSRWLPSPRRRDRSPLPSHSPRWAIGRHRVLTNGRCGDDAAARAPSHTTQPSTMSRWRGGVRAPVASIPASTRSPCSCCGCAGAYPTRCVPSRSSRGSRAATDGRGRQAMRQAWPATPVRARTMLSTVPRPVRRAIDPVSMPMVLCPPIAANSTDPATNALPA